MPGTGGQVRSWFFARALSQVSELFLVSLGGSGGGATAPKELKDLSNTVVECGRLQKPDRHGGQAGGWIRLVGAVLLPWRQRWGPFLDFCLHFSGLCPGRGAPLRRRFLANVFSTEYSVLSYFFKIPPLVTHLFSENFDLVLQSVLKEIRNKPYDIIWVEHSLMYPLAERLQSLSGKKFPVICNAHNVEWLLNERMAESAASPHEKRMAMIQKRLLKRLEKRVFTESALTLVCSQEDQRTALNLVPTARIEVIGNGVDTSYFFRPVDAERSPEPTILFTGSFGYSPNRDGLRFLVDEILPLILESVPNCRLVVAGAEAATAVEEMGIDHPSITWVSSPPDMRPSFYEAWVAMVPLRSGGGTRLKILEAMAMECALVSTTIGAEGIHCEHDVHLRLADDPVGFAGHVVDLLLHQSKREQQQVRALDWVRNHYEWEQLTAGLPKLLTKVASL